MFGLGLETYNCTWSINLRSTHYWSQMNSVYMGSFLVMFPQRPYKCKAFSVCLLYKQKSDICDSLSSFDEHNKKCVSVLTLGICLMLQCCANLSVLMYQLWSMCSVFDVLLFWLEASQIWHRENYVICLARFIWQLLRTINHTNVKKGQGIG